MTRVADRLIEQELRSRKWRGGPVGDIDSLHRMQDQVEDTIDGIDNMEFIRIVNTLVGRKMNIDWGPVDEVVTALKSFRDWLIEVDNTARGVDEE